MGAASVLRAWRAMVAAAVLCSLAGAASATAAAAPVTEQVYLSGAGPKTAVPWDFKVSAGRRAGEWSTIPVPSNWEQQGFGGYDYGDGDKQFTEMGQYRLKFAVPPSWRGRTIRLVFEGVMTETTVRVNGVQAGEPHVGGFYRFGYDITGLVNYSGSAVNLLEVDVSKKASDPLSDRAERGGDFWVFGGIFRPVWIEASPPQSIAHTAIDARADGSLMAHVTLDRPAPGAMVQAQVLDAKGRPFGKQFSAAVPADGTGGAPLLLKSRLSSPGLWTAETPNLYSLRLTLSKDGKVLHTATERFGFRTFELRKGDGLYLNGRKIIIKGVNRHSFRPESGRALDPEDCYADARLIKSMNMNTARMSHYPPDPAFLRAADELGLYVIDELSGWQAAHGTVIGRKLVREMVPRDVNHPSILFWANGNEGGFNFDLDGEFHLYDPQKRPVIHPWAIFSDIDTKHYPDWELVNQRLKGPNLFMPTEFMHALYDGGGGASLYDYWSAMMQSPFGAGGVIWALNDEGVARTDQDGRVDVYSTYAPDGVVGPHHEREGSYQAVRHIWSPVQLGDAVLDDGFDGKLKVDNHYDFNSLDRVRFAWRLLRYPVPAAATVKPRVLAQGRGRAQGVAPHGSGTLDLGLPGGWRRHRADALEVVATGPDGAELWTWTYPAPGPASELLPAARTAKAAPRVEQADDAIRLVAGAVSASFDAASGQLLTLRNGERVAALGNGPRLVYARPAKGVGVDWLPFASEDPATGIRRLASPQTGSVLEIVPEFRKEIAYARFKVEISADGEHWKTLFDASRRHWDGLAYRFSPQAVLAVRVTNPVDQHGKPFAFKSVRLGHAPQRFPDAAASATHVTSGAGRDSIGRPVAWVEARNSGGLDRVRWTLLGDGSLVLDYAYQLEGAVQYHGITFDHDETAQLGMRWLGQGPYRVWKNRLHGSWLGVHEVRHFDQQPGETFGYPESQGFFAGVRWARLDTRAGALLVQPGRQPGGAEGYLRVGTPRISHENTTVEFPAGDLSWLHAIPAIGEKFTPTEALGPSAAWSTANGEYQGSLTFRF